MKTSINTNVFFKEILPKSDDKATLLDNYIVTDDCLLLSQSADFVQNKHHKTDLWTHLKTCYLNSWFYSDDPILAMAAMFHDIGKVLTRRFSKEKNDWTFHGHETSGAKAIKHWMYTKKFESSEISRVELIIDQHQFRFYSDTHESTLRRWLCRVEKQGLNDLFIIRLIDRQSNPNNKHKPLETREFIDLRQQVFSLIASGKALFPHQLNISKDIFSKYIRPEEQGKIFDCVNFAYHNSNKNNPDDIEAYLKSAIKSTNETTAKVI